MRMIGVDVGGTFTDAVYYDEASGEIRWTKAPSTPDSPSDGVLDAIAANGIALGDIDRFVHGVTIGTNTILEHKGAPVWMVTTKGFGDVLEIARTNRTTLYNIKTLKAAPVVARHRVFEVDERLRAGGIVHRELDTAQIAQIAAELSEQEPAALAVCFVHSYANDGHEQAAVEILRQALPDWFICSSAEVLPEMREYERFNTTALNAYIGPVIKNYLAKLERDFRAGAYLGPIYLMISSGGIMTAERAQRLPIQTVLSGPAGGVAATVHLGDRLGRRNLIAYDMGGTSTDVCLIDDLSLPITSEQVIDEFPIRTPQIEIVTVGAGGGSIAWVDTGNILKVGPQSAGATPGPACYSLGGEEPTVTDANLVLNRLSADLKLAGSVALRPDLASRAVARILEAFPELDIKAAAEGIVRIAVARMVSAIKEISVSKGFDPREFALAAYGGAGPMHAAFVAEELEIPHILIPPGPGNFSAFGALISDIRHDYVRTHLLELDEADAGEIESIFEEIETQAQQELVSEGIEPDRITTARAFGMRYLGQSWDLPVRVPSDIGSVEEVADLFHQAHTKRFGYRADDPIEIVSLRLSASGEVDKPSLQEPANGTDLSAALAGHRPVHFSGNDHETAVYRRERLTAGSQFAGPAIVEEMGAVTVVPPGWFARIGKYGEIQLTRQET